MRPFAPHNPINPSVPDAWIVRRARANTKLMTDYGINFRIGEAGRFKEGTGYPRLVYSKIPQGVQTALGGSARLATVQVVIRVEMREDYLSTGQTLRNFLSPVGDEGISQELQRIYVGHFNSGTSSGHVWQCAFQDFYEAIDSDADKERLAMGIKCLIYFN